MEWNLNFRDDGIPEIRSKGTYSIPSEYTKLRFMAFRNYDGGLNRIKGDNIQRK